MKKVLAGWSNICPGCYIGRKYPDSFIGKKYEESLGKRLHRDSSHFLTITCQPKRM